MASQPSHTHLAFTGAFVAPPTGVSAEGNRPPGESLPARCVDFLYTIKSRFGETSETSIACHATLTRWHAGQASKEEALIKLAPQLHGHPDLEHELASILSQPEVVEPAIRYGELGERDNAHRPQPRDSIPSVQNDLTSPEFLQQQYRPQLYMPSLSSPWDASRQHRLSSPSVYSQPFQHSRQVPPQFSQGYRLGPAWSPSMPSEHPCFDLAQGHVGNDYGRQMVDRGGYNFPLVNHSSPPTISLNPFVDYGAVPSNCYQNNSNFGFGLQFSSPMPAHPQPMHSFSFNDTGNNWQSLNQAPAIPQNDMHVGSSPGSTRHSTSRIALPVSHPIPETSPPRKRARRATQALVKGQQNNAEDSNRGGLVNQVSQANLETESLRQPESSKSEGQPVTKEPKPTSGFVHSICGRAFSSRANVRRHHWGVKQDDLNTTTGCWHRNGRPDIPWDAHPSCSDFSSKVRGVLRQQTSTTRHNALADPSMGPRAHSLVPEIALPRENSLGIAASLYGMPTHPQHNYFGDPMPYHSAQFPGQDAPYYAPGAQTQPPYGEHGGRFNTLLTAVNAVPEIDTPIPQGRTDSIVPHLDAQAAGSEHQQSQTPAWFDGRLTQGNHHYGYSGGRVLADFTSGPSVGSRRGINGNPGADYPAYASPRPFPPFEEPSAADSAAKKKRNGFRHGISKDELKGLGLRVSPVLKTQVK